MRAPGLARAAAALLMLEAVGIGVVVVIESVGLLSGDATSETTAIALVVLTAIGAGALALFSINVLRGKSWARSGGVMLHVLAVVLAIAAFTVEPPSPAFSATIGIPGLIGLVLLVMSQRAEAAPVKAKPKPKPEGPEENLP
jgi:hypothetical protein